MIVSQLICLFFVAVTAEKAASEVCGQEGLERFILVIEGGGISIFNADDRGSVCH